MQFKESERGTEEVCKLVEDYGKECAEEAAKKVARDNARRFFENGASYDIVRKSIPLLNDEELQKIYAESQMKMRDSESNYHAFFIIG